MIGKANESLPGNSLINQADPIEIDIYRKDEYLTTQLAKEYRPGLVNQGVPRKGFIGFEFHWENGDFHEDEICCVVRSSGQEIV